jgi:hypothetical protein
MALGRHGETSPSDAERREHDEGFDVSIPRCLEENALASNYETADKLGVAYFSILVDCKKCFLLNDRIYRSDEVFFAQPIVLCQVLWGLFDSIVKSPNG